MVWRTRNLRIAVTGLRNTGKTVFITSLINHLMNHSPDLFDLGLAKKRRKQRPREIHGFREIRGDGGSVFDYKTYRHSMANDMEWPKKSKDHSRFLCSFEVSSKRRVFHCEFRDFPGERFADVWMENNTYAQWSDAVLRWMHGDPEYTVHIDHYRNLLEHQSLEEERVLNEYKRSLYRLVTHYKPLISPSTFLLDLKGEQALQNADEEKTIRERIVGVDVESQFAPLSTDARTASPELAEIFAVRYERYREEIVRPLMRSLRECNRMIVLVDVPQILQAGPGMLNDNREVLAYMLAGLQPANSAPPKSLAKRLAHLLGANKLRPGKITKLAIVGVKSDKVSAQDHDNLDYLVKEMTRDIVHSCVGVESRCFHASAVVSTTPAEDGALVGRTIYDEHGRRRTDKSEVEFTPRFSVPAEWPDDWQPNHYEFPDVYPRFPKPLFNPPRQSKLNDILAFLLDIPI